MSLLNQPVPAWKVRTLEGEIPPGPEAFRGQPLLVLFWNLGCPNCKSRALPFSKELLRVHPHLQMVAIHTHPTGRVYSSAQVNEIKQLLKIDYPVYLDEGMATYLAWEAEGTPHWTLINAEGKVHRNIFGSMPNALQRLDYALREWRVEE
jgi:thiol-disulfide isomerase/thioredoxin